MSMISLHAASTSELTAPPKSLTQGEPDSMSTEGQSAENHLRELGSAAVKEGWEIVEYYKAIEV